MRASYLFTSESVSEGHPDKVCDRISDEIVDLFYREGPKAGIDPWQIRAACETLATTNKVVIAGETRGPSSVTNEQIEGVVRSAIKDIGYEQDGFHWKTCDIEILLHPQSADIAQGVDALQPGDALLICGKGHETGQIVGSDVFPFDDAEQASVAVAALDGKL